MKEQHNSWFKPLDTEKILFYQYFGDEKLTLRSFQMNNDLDIIHAWVNQDYSRRFWQLYGSRQMLADTYAALLESQVAHPFIVLEKDKPVALVDLYLVSADPLGALIMHHDNDCGLHLLMLPPKASRKNLSLQVLHIFTNFYFFFPGSGDLYAEPDKENHLANVLAKRAGFELLQTVQMSYKTANLYRIRKRDFHPNY